jgi:hypothetical protein
VRVGDLLGKATPRAYAGGAVTLSSPQQQLQARAQLADHPLALRRLSWLWASPIPGIQDGARGSPFPPSASWLNRSDSIYL